MPKAGKFSKPQSLSDRVVLITGATAGIGEACAWRFADAGSRLILVGRRAERLESLKSELVEEYPDLKVHCEAMSVTDLPAVEALPESLPEGFKNVEILVNNAGLALGVNPVYENSVQTLLQ